eukprot:NODE_9405_length_1426_cov_8.052348.p1 GENE.NODE_9405_length_1426_cov_8.052348~~NODE_9405_length_1426_cov_8.052348.p1  ORF type:complete len:346 (+),score=70.79 NODE_9405_length_1426_cov_8.052348:92-1129(+)
MTDQPANVATTVRALLPPSFAGGGLLPSLATQREFMRQWGLPLEQLLPMLVYITPVGDEDDDLAGFQGQALQSISELFSLYRTTLLRDKAAMPLDQSSKSTPGAGTLVERRRDYAKAGTALRGLRCVQLLMEMRALSSGGRRCALRACMLIELVKLFLRWRLKGLTPFSFYVDEDAADEAFEELKSQFGGEVAVGLRTGRKMNGLGSTRSLGSSRSPASSLMAVAEALFHAGPFVHLLLLMRRGRRSWLAWLASLYMEGLSLVLLSLALKPKPHTRAARLELAELQRRRSALLWALLRSPCFDKFLKRPCEAANRVLCRIPILNIFNAFDLGLALQPFYFSTAAH